MANRMVTTIRVINIYVDQYENQRECPFYSELKGMEMTLKTFGIDFDYEYNEDLEITAVTVQGHKATV